MVPDYVLLGACFEIKNCALAHAVAIQLRLDSTSKKNTCALLARITPPPMLTDAAPSALRARTALPPVMTDGAASTLLALIAHPPVMTDAATSTLLTLTALPPVIAFGTLRRWLRLAVRPARSLHLRYYSKADRLRCPNDGEHSL